MKISVETLYEVHSTSEFKKQLKKIVKQGKDVSKLEKIVERLANDEILELKYHNHILNNSRYYKNCQECHIEPDWLLVYKYQNKELILLLVATGKS